MNSSRVSVRTRFHFQSDTEEVDGRSSGAFPISFGTEFRVTSLSSWPAFTEAGILGSGVPAFAGAANMALQRTRRPRLRSGRSLRSLGSPLNARPLARTKCSLPI
jgi:hypothetical protein